MLTMVQAGQIAYKYLEISNLFSKILVIAWLVFAAFSYSLPEIFTFVGAVSTDRTQGSRRFKIQQTIGKNRLCFLK